MADWIVHKFGGTSLANADRFINVANIIMDWKQKLPTVNQGVVVSAMSGVTNALERACKEAEATFHTKREALGSIQTYQNTLNDIHQKHLECLRSLHQRNEVDDDAASRVASALDRDVTDLRDVLRAVALSGAAPVSLSELVMGHGEIWSAQILHAVIDRRVNASTYRSPSGVAPTASWLDAREVLVVRSAEEAFQAETGPAFTTFERVYLNWETSAARMREWIVNRRARMGLLRSPDGNVIIATGYVCSSANGAPSTLKRNGSDYSAALLGALLSARLVVVWSDVPGILAADPRVVSQAAEGARGGALPFVSCNECVELAYFGAKVLHPFTLQPLLARSIPVLLKSSLQPDIAGTLVAEQPGQLLRPLSKTEKATFASRPLCCQPSPVPELNDNHNDNHLEVPSHAVHAVDDLASHTSGDDDIVPVTPGLDAKQIEADRREAQALAELAATLRFPHHGHSNDHFATVPPPSPACASNNSNSNAVCLAQHPALVQDDPSAIMPLCLESFAAVACQDDYRELGNSLGCKALTSIDDVALLTVTGAASMGVPLLCARLFSALHDVNASVLLISQASSQHSVSVALIGSQATRALIAVRRAFFRELQQSTRTSHVPLRIDLERGCSMVCAVGAAMAGAPGVLSRLSGALRSGGVNVRVVTQSASEANVSFVINAGATKAALIALHQEMRKA